MRGRKQTPTALKVARGNPGKRPLNHEEPEFPLADLAAPPAGFTGRALEEWTRLAPQMMTTGLVTVGDVTAFSVYCLLVGDEQAWREKVELARDSDERIRLHAHLLKIRGQLRQYMTEHGLTPSSRSGVKAKKPVDPADAKRKRFLNVANGGSA